MREMVEEMVDDLLDSDGPVIVAGLQFYASAILKEMDPTAYRLMCSDIADNLISDLQYELDNLDPEVDADEIADIQDRIDTLERL
jgi:hypothetical protein